MGRAVHGIMLAGAVLLSTPAARGQEAALLARNLAATCAACHGTAGAALGEMPPLAGLTQAQIEQAMADYKNAARSAGVMSQIAKGYSDAQIHLIAGHYAGLSRARAPQR